MQTSWIVIAIVATVAVLGALRCAVNVLAANRFAGEHRTHWQSSPSERPLLSADGHGNSLMIREMTRFDKSIALAIETRTLQYFDLGQNLTPIHRAVGSVSGFLRPAAGWCLLLGLTITLFNLQGAVGELSKAFSNLSGVEHANSANVADGGVSTSNREQNVTDRMAGMADMASRAFRMSLAFICIALLCGVSSAFLERSGRKAALEFEEWAVTFYQSSLPGQLPITEGTVAHLLAESMKNMTDVIEELRTASGAFANLQPLVSAMSGATIAIETAMRQLPEDVRSSMSSITSEMVTQLNETLGESTEYTKKILAIYAEQELRVKSLHTVVTTTHTALVEIRNSHKLLETLPAQTIRLSDAAASLAASSKEISVRLDLIPTESLAEAARALSEGQRALVEASERAQVAYLRLMSVTAGPNNMQRDGGG